MHQRVTQPVEHRLVQLRLGALGDQFDMFMQFARQIADQPLEPAERGTDWHQPNGEDNVAKCVGQPFRHFHGGLKGYVRRIARNLAEARLIGDQLAHQIDQRIELIGGHPNAVTLRRGLLRGDGRCSANADATLLPAT